MSLTSGVLCWSVLGGLLYLDGIAPWNKYQALVMNKAQPSKPVSSTHHTFQLPCVCGFGLLQLVPVGFRSEKKILTCRSLPGSSAGRTGRPLEGS